MADERNSKADCSSSSSASSMFQRLGYFLIWFCVVGLVWCTLAAVLGISTLRLCLLSGILGIISSTLRQRQHTYLSFDRSWILALKDRIRCQLIERQIFGLLFRILRVPYKSCIRHHAEISTFTDPCTSNRCPPFPGTFLVVSKPNFNPQLSTWLIPNAPPTSPEEGELFLKFHVNFFKLCRLNLWYENRDARCLTSLTLNFMCFYFCPILSSLRIYDIRRCTWQERTDGQAANEKTNISPKGKRIEHHRIYALLPLSLFQEYFDGRLLHASNSHL